MTENDENLLPRQRPLRDSNPISHESSTPVGLPAGAKAAKIVRVLFAQIGPEGVVQTGSSFGSRGHPRSLRRCRSTEDKISYIFLTRAMCLSRVVLELRRKKRSFRKKRKLVAMATSLEYAKIDIRLVHLQP